MTKNVFTFALPQKLTITKELLRETLADVRDQLLNHGINGGPRKLVMETVCDSRGRNDCGTAACIGGWTSIFLLGFEGGTNSDKREIVESMFSFLMAEGLGDRRLHNLFFEYGAVQDYDAPNVAATAIQRYLDGQRPWPDRSSNGARVPMPNVLPYKRTAAKAKKKA